jgi:uncharacterized membrane protein
VLAGLLAGLVVFGWLVRRTGDAVRALAVVGAKRSAVADLAHAPKATLAGRALNVFYAELPIRSIAGAGDCEEPCG